MTNALTAFTQKANLPTLSNADMAAALADSNADNGTGSGGDMNFLSFSGKTGNYALGRDKVGMDPDDIYLLDIRTIMEGWLCWKSNKPVGRVEWSVYMRDDQAVKEADLEDHGPYRSAMGEGWQRVMGFGVLPTDGDNTPIKFTASSVSGRNAIAALNKEIQVRLDANEPATPLISFESEEFVAQDQKNFKPKFVIDAWVTTEAATAFYDGELTIDQLSAGEKPKKKRKKK